MEGTKKAQNSLGEKSLRLKSTLKLQQSTVASQPSEKSSQVSALRCTPLLLGLGKSWNCPLTPCLDHLEDGNRGRKNVIFKVNHQGFFLCKIFPWECVFNKTKTFQGNFSYSIEILFSPGSLSSCWFIHVHPTIPFHEQCSNEKLADVKAQFKLELVPQNFQGSHC